MRRVLKHDRSLNQRNHPRKENIPKQEKTRYILPLFRSFILMENVLNWLLPLSQSLKRKAAHSSRPSLKKTKDSETENMVNLLSLVVFFIILLPMTIC
jgi:hypothetical protein